MKLQVLVAAVNQNVDVLPEKMGLETDAILVNQCGYAAYQEYEHKGKQVLFHEGAGGRVKPQYGSFACGR